MNEIPLRKRQHHQPPGWAETRQGLRQKLYETLHSMWGGDTAGLNAWSCLGHICPAPLSSSAWQPTFMAFSVTQILLLYLWVAVQVSHSQVEILIFFLSRISATLSEYNLLSPMLNQGNMFPIFNSVYSTPRAFETEVGETGESCCIAGFLT